MSYQVEEIVVPALAHVLRPDELLDFVLDSAV
jgi:hypothetical protein